MNAFVYLLWFIPEFDDDENGLLIGVYSSDEEVRLATERLQTKPGFSSFPEGFQIHTRELNRDGWAEGFAVEGKVVRSK